ncbi:MAG: hypothetical protein QME05_02835 [Candidatus Margulisbacteria bacterium]|nr:hypothetical protein [Candidatus Margulisiibacteriota bacterium]
MKKICLTVCCLLFTSMAFADTTGLITPSNPLLAINQFMPNGMGGVGIGYVTSGSAETVNVSWHPDFKFGFFSVGLDVNLPMGGSSIPSGLDSIVWRSIAYDDGLRGLRYGVIESLTWGSGLLMDRYSTRLTGTVILDNRQLAFVGYLNAPSDITVRALATKTSLDGVRIEKKVNPMLTVGGSFLCDYDGVVIPAAGTNQQVNGAGVDAKIPLPMNFEGYAEVAQLLNHGNGTSVGISWGQDIMIAKANFSAEYRMLDKGFAPGYFNSEYEYNPVNLTSLEATGQAKNGYLIRLDADALSMASLKATYEQYNQSNGAVSAYLYGKLPQKVELSGYYSQPTFTDFTSLSFEQGAILGGTLAYPINTFTDIVAHYKKAYNSATARVEETQYYELRFNL